MGANPNTTTFSKILTKEERWLDHIEKSIEAKTQTPTTNFRRQKTKNEFGRRLRYVDACRALKYRLCSG